MMRGRLIQIFLAEIARLDTVATEAGGFYDEDFREVIEIDTDGDGIGESQRQEHTVILVPCQIDENTWELLQKFEQGIAPQTDIIIWFHFEDLERMSLVTADGRSLISIGDRLVSIKDAFSQEIVHTVRTPPGLYVIEARPRGWGLCMSRPTRNLLRVSFSERSAVV